MGKTFVRYSFITIGVYLFATYATGAGKGLFANEGVEAAGASLPG
jgi:hypothetical protein